jgi:hypothetical protein
MIDGTIIKFDKEGFLEVKYFNTVD